MRHVGRSGFVRGGRAGGAHVAPNGAEWRCTERSSSRRIELSDEPGHVVRGRQRPDDSDLALRSVEEPASVSQ